MNENPITLEEFQKALPVLDLIEQAGFEAYFVGGSVRDALIGIAVNDVDIATSALPEEIKAIFPKTVDIGIEHGTVLVLTSYGEYEITTFRTESTYHDYRRPDEVQFVRSLEEDLKRRDFTINALALNRGGNLIDYYEGLKDLKRGIIRAVGQAQERFNEDALRMMRAVRFASQLDFNIEEKTLKAIAQMHPLLEHIAVERITVEFDKLLMGKNHAKGLQALVSTGLYKFCPGLKNAKDSLLTLAKLDSEFPHLDATWALLIYFMIENQILAEDITQWRQFLRQWKRSNKQIEHILNLLKAFLYRKDGQSINSFYLFEYGLEDSLMVEQMRELMSWSSSVEEVRSVYSQLPIKTSADLAVSGSDLLALTKNAPGPWVGVSLKKILNLVLSGQLKNQKEIILDYVSESEF